MSFTFIVYLWRVVWIRLAAIPIQYDKLLPYHLLHGVLDQNDIYPLYRNMSILLQRVWDNMFMMIILCMHAINYVYWPSNILMHWMQ